MPPPPPTYHIDANGKETIEYEWYKMYPIGGNRPVSTLSQSHWYTDCLTFTTSICE
ncbi:hypothetical protein EVJ58_g84 [Rhodofomes roseus]|uniref:Uncharacterized protein n=1 Tax=Rhodofomes roseus TaxID=34475 RepID=A0A4Y9Z7F7_9APHY|nr:hypothetical protein EVJ58_g84 [Rhodofomes roseus]